MNHKVFINLFVFNDLELNLYFYFNESSTLSPLVTHRLTQLIQGE